MGQYYFPTIIRKKGKRYFSNQFYSHDYHNGLKLMEHSYVGNIFTETVIGQLYNNPGRLAWMGDYHEEGDIVDAELDVVFRRHYQTFYDTCGKGKKTYSHPEELKQRKGRYILNHDKKVYIDMVKYSELAPKRHWGLQIHPLPLLTAVGNGRGGGDFYNEAQEDDIGIWAGDLIEIQDAKPNCYTDVTENYFFEEEY